MIKQIRTSAALVVFFLEFASVPQAFAGKTALPDSSGGRSIATVRNNQGASAPSGAANEIKPASSGIDAKVEYSARTIESDKSKGVITLLGDAKVKYKEITIEAGKITINWKKNIVVAEEADTTAMADSVGGAKKRGLPLFSDGKEKMTGARMEYNFKSEKGRIVRGRTQFQKGYFAGDAVKRVDSNIFFVSEGSYTTCDKEEPHFHFRGKKMKVIANDKVIARPVVFFLGKIPLAIFPFAIFPAKESGRQSGIIIPQFGSSPTEGRYLRNLGYYWATNDYMDMQLTMDFYDRAGVLFRGKTNYAKRYKFSGSVSGSFTHKNFPSGRRERLWNLRVRHSQTIDENTRFTVNALLQNSDTFYKDLSDNRSERLNRQIQSNATFSKRWDEGKNNLTVNIRQQKDVESGSSSLTLPQLNFTRNRSAIIPFRQDSRGRNKDESKWYNQIFYDYRLSASNVVNDDTTDSPPPDIRKANHRISLSFTPKNKLLGVVGLNQSFNYEEDWLDRRKENFTLVDSTNTFNFDEKKGFFRRYKYSYTANTTTNLYGTFPGVGPVKAVRHKMSPSVGFSFSPELKDKYFESVEDTNGVKRELDRFQGSPRGKSMNMNFRLNNLFQMKVGQTGKERVVKLFDLNFSSSYNFAADSLRLSNLSTRFQANPMRALSVTMGMSHSFYRFDQTLNRRINDFIRPQLTSVRIDARWSLSGKKAKSSQKPAAAGQEAAPVTQLGATGPRAGGDYQDGFSPESAFSALDIPWKANLSFSYSVNKSNPNFTTRTAYVDLSNVELQVTQNWRLGYKLRYDLEKTRVVDQRLSFYRDLHCWEARFDWSPSGIGKGYYFIVNIKAPQLRQVKVERRGGTTSIFKPF